MRSQQINYKCYLSDFFRNSILLLKWLYFPQQREFRKKSIIEKYKGF